MSHIKEPEPWKSIMWVAANMMGCSQARLPAAQSPLIECFMNHIMVSISVQPWESSGDIFENAYFHILPHPEMLIKWVCGCVLLKSFLNNSNAWLVWLMLVDYADSMWSGRKQRPTSKGKTKASYLGLQWLYLFILRKSKTKQLTLGTVITLDSL